MRSPGQCLRRRAQEPRRVQRPAGAVLRAGIAQLQALLGGAEGEPELERLGVGALRAQRELPAMVLVEMRALGVEQQRVLLRRGREVTLGEADHAHGPEAHVAQGVDVDHVDAARAEGARATRSRIVCA